mgnify:CR=1 FL=1
MKQTIGIIGAGGHAKVVADALMRANPRASLIFFSSEGRPEGGRFLGRPHFREEANLLERKWDHWAGWHVAIGDPELRAAKISQLLEKGARLVTVIHPDSIVSERCAIGPGSFVAAGAIVNIEAKVGAGCIINTAASVDHDSALGDFVNIGPGCRICGGVTVGSNAQVGSGAVIIPGVTIGEGCIVGAGAVVIRDLRERTMAIGVPARVVDRG